MISPLGSTRPRHLVLAFAFSFLTSSSRGLKFTPGSACASYCLDSAGGNPLDPNDSSTTASDIVCNNVDYWSTDVGTKYRTCMNCLQNSTAVNGTESDAAWYLYNVRYAVDVCLFSFPSADSSNTSTSSPCALSNNCKPLKTALETGNLNPDNETEWQYCSADSNAFTGPALNNCIQCLQTETQQSYLSNFLTALSAGCQQKPPSGDLLGLNGTLFTTSAVSIINPPWNQTAPGQATPVTSMNTGMIVGIAVGAGLLLLGAIALFIYYWRRQKRSRTIVFQDFQPSPHFRQIKSISSTTSGGFVPFYTTDYKNHQIEPRNIELYDNIKTQQFMVPVRHQPAEKEMPDTASLWGHDTPLPTRPQLGSGMGDGLRSSTPNSQQMLIHSSSHIIVNDDNINNMSQNLDEMPTHPAFIPRAFHRPSRNPIAPVEPQARPKSNKPDTYAIQRYLETAEDPSKVDIASLTVPLPPPSNAQRTAAPAAPAAPVAPAASNRPAALGSTPQYIPPPPPGPPPGPGESSASPKLTPSLVLPSLSHIRKPKRYIPPPITIEEPRQKAQRLATPTAEGQPTSRSQVLF